MEVVKVFLCEGISKEGYEYQDVVADTEEELQVASDVDTFELATWDAAMQIPAYTGTIFENYHIELTDGVYKWVNKIRFNHKWVDKYSKEYDELKQKELADDEFCGYVPVKFKDNDYAKMRKYLWDRKYVIEY